MGCPPRQPHPFLVGRNRPGGRPGGRGPDRRVARGAGIDARGRQPGREVGRRHRRRTDRDDAGPNRHGAAVPRCGGRSGGGSSRWWSPGSRWVDVDTPRISWLQLKFILGPLDHHPHRGAVMASVPPVVWQRSGRSSGAVLSTSPASGRPAGSELAEGARPDRAPPDHRGAPRPCPGHSSRGRSGCRPAGEKAGHRCSASRRRVGGRGVADTRQHRPIPETDRCQHADAAVGLEHDRGGLLQRPDALLA